MAKHRCPPPQGGCQLQQQQPADLVGQRPRLLLLMPLLLLLPLLVLWWLA